MMMCTRRGGLWARRKGSGRLDVVGRYGLRWVCVCDWGIHNSCFAYIYNKVCRYLVKEKRTSIYLQYERKISEASVILDQVSSALTI